MRNNKEDTIDINIVKWYLSTLNSQLSTPKGFTLIELVVVFSIVGIITTIGMASFVSFSNSQTVDGATSDVANAYMLARQRALSQIKPSECTSAQTLSGYQVILNSAAQTYQTVAICDTITVPIASKQLPPRVTFGAGSPTTILFNVPNATVSSPGTVTIDGYGKSKTIRIDGSGSISVQ